MGFKLLALFLIASATGILALMTVLVAKKDTFVAVPTTPTGEIAEFDSLKVARDRAQLDKWLLTIGPTRYLEKMMADSGGGSKKDCHQEAHLVGRRAYDLFGATVFSEKNGFVCHSGFLHGTTEGFIKDKGVQNLAREIDGLCNQFATSFGNFECLHGVGHGLLAYVDYDLPQAVELCGKLGNDFARSSCYGGLFMENIMAASGGGASEIHQTKWVSTDAHFPCNGLSKDSVLQTQCYLMQTSRMLTLYNYDFAKVAAACENAPDSYISTCFQSYGRDAAGNSLREPKRTLALCKKVPSRYFQNCVSGALNVIVDFWGDKLTDQPQGLCKLMDNDKDKTYCYNLFAGRLRNVFGDNEEKILAACAVVEEDYQDGCLSAVKI